MKYKVIEENDTHSFKLGEIIKRCYVQDELPALVEYYSLSSGKKQYMIDEEMEEVND